MKYCFAIPVYKHGSSLENVVQHLIKYQMPIIIIDDGNDDDNNEYIRKVLRNYTNIILISHNKNMGKGQSIFDAIRKAKELGFTHIFQLDSDGQHDTEAIPEFLDLSRQNPNAVIAGSPIYGEDAPHTRVNGRKIANLWIQIVTLDSHIKDAMIGFRIYPVEPFYELLSKGKIRQKRMGFDIEIIVKLSWIGVPIISHGVRIFYPKNNISNYNFLKDNIRISILYTSLCLGMFTRFVPILLRRIHGK